MQETAITHIHPGRSEVDYLRECWAKREIPRFFARRDFVVRYRAMIVGMAWVLLKPAVALGVFSLVFGKIAGLPSFGVPYPVMVMAGLIAWQFFASVVAESSISIVNSPSLITKVSFPRVLVPVSTLALNSVDLLLNSAFLALVMAWYGVLPSWHLVFVPIPLLVMAVASLGAGLLISALMVRYRDFRNIVPVMLQFGMLLSPVAFTIQAAPAGWAGWMWLNPLCAPIEAMRWCILPGYPMPPWGYFLMSSLMAVAVLVIGYRYFRNSERSFADVI